MMIPISNTSVRLKKNYKLTKINNQRWETKVMMNLSEFSLTVSYYSAKNLNSSAEENKARNVLDICDQINK